jgi:hypothetical protein
MLVKTPICGGEKSLEDYCFKITEYTNLLGGTIKLRFARAIPCGFGKQDDD